MHDKRLSNWTDSASQGVRDGTDEDLTFGLGGEEGGVKILVTKSGPLMVTDCTKCGRQWKGIFTWPEVCCYFLGRFEEPLVKDRARPSKQGVLARVACNGGSSSHDFLAIVEWDTVRQWIDSGIRSNLVSREILRAPRQ